MTQGPGGGVVQRVTGAAPGAPPAAEAGAFLAPRFAHDFSQTAAHSPGAPRPALAVGPPGDSYEQEAERVARQIMGPPAPRPARAAPPLIQRLAGTAGGPTQAAPASVAQALSGPGQPLAPALRRDMEQHLGHDFRHVRVHTGAAAERSARDVRARAYTLGPDIVFGPGQYAPATAGGRQLLAHELVHVVQQGVARRAPIIQRAPLDCGTPTLQCPPNSALVNETSSQTIGTLVHTMVQHQYLSAHQPALGPENFILIDRGWGEVHTRAESSQSISRLAILDPPVHGAFAKGAKRGDRATGNLAQRPDILDDQRDTVYEIKSCTPDQAQAGRSELVDYFSRLAFAPQKIPPSGSRRDRSWRSGTWMPAAITSNQGDPRFQVVFSMPQPGLILYAIWACRRRAGRDQEPDPPMVFDWQGEPKGDSKSAGESKGQGDGRAGKSNGRPGRGDRGGRTPPADQPALRLPRGDLWDKVYAAIAVIGGLAALFSLWGKVGALLGLLLRALGITLGLTAGAAAAPGDTSGAPGGPPVVKPVPGGTTGRPAGRPTPGRAPGGRGRTGARQAGGAPPSAPKAIKIDLIEGINPERVAPAMIYPVQFTDLGRGEGEGRLGVAILQVAQVHKTEGGTTVTFRALQHRMHDARTGAQEQSEGGRHTYVLTHPYDAASGPPGLVGSVMYPGSSRAPWFWAYLENLANKLEQGGQDRLAEQVRREVARLRRLAQQ